MQYGISLFKRLPVLRFLMPFIAGILCQFYCHIPFLTAIVSISIALVVMCCYKLLTHANKFMYIWLNGIAICVLFFGIGNVVSFIKNSQHHPLHVGNYYKTSSPVLVTLKEPLVTKPNSYKALATIDAVLINGKWQPVAGNILLYFKKDLVKPNLGYGNQLVITKPLMPITNAGNPGGFNYKQYCAFQDIYYQVFLNNNNFKTLASSRKSVFDTYLIKTRLAVLYILRNNIHSVNELAVAEALLIGYRDDLDRVLVQAYSNTGVVHIIAISGLHLGMIYGLLVLLLEPFRKFRLAKFLKPLVIVTVLWGFTFIAGAVPSILRSAVMFTCIVLGDSVGKRSNIYNTLAVSAMVILLFNPFSLWDVGFQLSYAAVLSIVLFAKNIEQLFYFKNKLLKWFWALNALTLSAQILTLPIILYHFHQFPTLFFVTNLVAVPLSGIILYAELLLLLVTLLPTVATVVGAITERLLWLMNDFIERINRLPFSVLNSLQINIVQTILLYGAIGGVAWWLLYKKPKAVLIGLSALLLFFVIRYWDFTSKIKQQQLVVYNVPQHASIDIMQGRQYLFIGDSVLQADGFLRNFHLLPSRVLHRVAVADSLTNIMVALHSIISTNKTVIIIDNPLPKYYQPKQKIIADVVILSKNPKIYFTQLTKIFNCKQYVFDGSNPTWKVNYWKKDADSLGLQYYDVAKSGAFIMGL